jgi:hypothetical protein
VILPLPSTNKEVKKDLPRRDFLSDHPSTSYRIQHTLAENLMEAPLETTGQICRTFESRRKRIVLDADKGWSFSGNPPRHQAMVH